MNEELLKKNSIVSESSWEQDSKPMVQLVIFVLHDELFAAPIRQVVEIIKPMPLTRMPRMPAFVSGILNLRGQVFPVVDLKKRLSMSSNEATERTRIIKAEVRGEPIGFIVDEVREVLRVGEDQIDDPPTMVGDETAVYLSGVVRDEERMILLFDLEILFGSENALLESRNRV